MRRSRAYILTEIMMSMLLQAMFITVLSGAFYMMLSFYTKTQQLQTARERGHRVISYFDQRIRQAGLGLWACENSKVIESFLQTGGGVMNSYKMNLPVSVISKEPRYANYYKEGIDKSNSPDFTSAANHHYEKKNSQTFIGNIVTIMYAYRDFDNSLKFILEKNDTLAKTPDTLEKISAKFSLIDKNGFQKSGFKDADINNISNLYAAIESAGLPLRQYFDEEIIKLALDVEAGMQYPVYAGGELLHVGCERLFVTSNDIPEERSFAFAFPGASKWSQPYHHVAGILEIYMELHAPNNAPKTFDLYVLSTGGRDGASSSRSRPVTWPKEARWDDKYCDQVLYVSRASWKLNNIPENFVFSYPN